jgi:hypothetical protein
MPLDRVPPDFTEWAGLATLDSFMMDLRRGAWINAKARTDGGMALTSVLETLALWPGLVDDWPEFRVHNVGRLETGPWTLTLDVWVSRRTVAGLCYPDERGDRAVFLLREVDGRWKIVGASPPLCQVAGAFRGGPLDVIDIDRRHPAGATMSVGPTTRLRPASLAA